MIRIFKHYIPKSILILALIECVMLYIAIWMAMAIRIGDEAWGFYEYSTEKFFYVLIVYLVLLATGLYRLDTCRDIKMSVARLSVSMVLSLLAVSATLYMFPSIDIWRSVSVYAITITFLLLILSRLFFRYVVDNKSIETRVIVLGAGKEAKRVLNCNGKATSHVNFIAFIRMDENENSIEDAVDYESVESLEKLAKDNACQEIVVAIDERRGTLPMSDLLACKMNGTYISEAASFIERRVGALNLATFSPSWMIFSDGFDNTKRIDLFAKRIFDIFASAILLIVGMPILLLTALAVKVTSKGSVFYRQERIGQLGRIFKVIKFRSMDQDAEADGVPRWAQKADARVTSVGRFIRKTRIDEIPQIFNVLSGDMSFVGPRPERPFFAKQLTEIMPLFDKRHTVKPGITGWAQVNYPYGASVEDSRRKLEYDLYYIKNYSVFLDLLILVQTVRVVLWAEGVR